MKQPKPLLYILLVTFLLVAAIPFCIEITHDFITYSTSSEQYISTRLQNIAETSDFWIQNFLQNYKQRIESLAAAINPTTDSADELHKTFKAWADLDNNILGLALITPEHTLISPYTDNPEIFSNINIKRHLKNYLQKITAHKTQTELVFPLLTPLSENGYYLLVLLNSKFMNKSPATSTALAEIDIDILSNRGQLIASNHPNNPLTKVKNPVIIDKLHAEESGFINYTSLGTDLSKRSFFQPLTVGKIPTNLILVTSVTLPQQLSFFTYALSHTLLPVIILIILAIIATASLYRYISKPISEIIKIIFYIQGGVLEHRVAAQRQGELGLLIKSFNDMVRNLEKRLQYQKRMKQEILLRNRYEEKLKSSREEAVSLSKAKDEFLANISHEIRTPLNAIIGFSEKIILEYPDAPFTKNVKTILSESDHLLLLLNDLLDNAKIEADKLDLEYIPFDLHKCLAETVDPYRESASKKNITMTLEISPDTPRYVIFDPLRFRQVLVNLLSNAIKFTEKGSIRIKTAVSSSTSDHTDVYFSVIDTGIGIPKEKQKTIFDQFSQADGSTTRKYGGTGLGTTISKKLVTLMGGEMCLESEPGKGSTFWFTLSLNTNISDNDLIKISTDNNSTPSNNAKKFTGTVLVAEDYEVNQELIRSQLEYLGLNVLIAGNGRIAIEDCKRIFFDLVFMDLQMPEMGGIEAARRIRIDYPHYEKVPIIALTANADKDIRNVCKAVGMNGILNKPTHIDELAASLLKWLPRSCKISPVSISAQAEEKSADNSFTSDNVLIPDTNSYQKPQPRVEPPIDFAEAYKLFGNNQMVFNMALKNFIDSLETTIIPQLEQSLHNEDSEMLRSNAHKLKGGAASVTAKKLSRIAGILEKNSEKANLEEANHLIGDIKNTFIEVKEYISKQQNNS